MTNKEWLEFIKKSDNTFIKKYSNKISDMSDNTKLQWRQAKALEIIAEELIKLNETFDNGLNITGDINTTGEMDFKGSFDYFNDKGEKNNE